MEQIHILGIKVTSGKVEELHEEITKLIRSGKQGYVLYANIYAFNVAEKAAWLADFYNRADIVICDGSGIMLAGKILGKHIPERITYADWGWTFARYCAQNKYKLYFVGGPDNLAEQAVFALQSQIPNLNIAGARHGYFDKKGRENEDVIADINRAQPDILLVGMGIGLQEKWIIDNHSKLDVKIFMPCGAAFRYWAGWTKRSPLWMRHYGFEWLYRFLQEPRRMAKRYLWGNPYFMARVLIEKARIQISKEFGQKN